MNKNATFIKADLIDFLLSSESFDLIVNEAPFLQGSRWADLLAIQGENIIGFEVKSGLDNLNNLHSQIADYNKVCNKTYVVISEKFINSPEVRTLPRHNGIIISYATELKIKRRAQLKQRLDKRSLSYFLWRRDLEKLYQKNKFHDVEILREKVVSSISIKQLQKASLLSLKNRYGASFKLFLHDREGYTSLEDLNTITGIKKFPYLYDTGLVQS